MFQFLNKSNHNDIQTTISNLEPLELSFLKALKDEHEQLKEKSIFSQFFHGIDFYDNEIMQQHYDEYYKSYYVKNPRDYDPSEVKIMSNSCPLFSYEGYNTNHLIVSNNRYYYVDDESTILDLGNFLFEFPLVLFNPLNEKPRIPLDFEQYRDFCRPFGLDFDLKDYRWENSDQLPF